MCITKKFHSINSYHLPLKPTIYSISWQGTAILHFKYQIYKQKMHGLKYVWVIHTPDKYGWWKRTLNGVNCTPEQVNEGAKGIIYVNYMWLSKSKKRTMSGMVRTCESTGSHINCMHGGNVRTFGNTENDLYYCYTFHSS